MYLYGLKKLECITDIFYTILLLTSLGFIIEPSNKLHILGFLMNSITTKITLIQEKNDDLRFPLTREFCPRKQSK